MAVEGLQASLAERQASLLAGPSLDKSMSEHKAAQGRAQREALALRDLLAAQVLSWDVWHHGHLPSLSLQVVLHVKSVNP